MIKLEDLLNQEPKQEIFEMDDLAPLVNGDMDFIHEEPIIEIPDYIINDPEIVGYPDEQFQNDIYQWALGWYYNDTIVDVGCGRGDFYQKIDDYDDPKYTGFELNEVLIRAGRIKYPEINIKNENFLDYDGNNFDRIFFIGSLNQDYGFYDTSTFWGKYDYFKKVLFHSLKHCNKSLIFILLQDAENDFIAHPISEVTSILTKENLPFHIDYSKFNGIYKLEVFKP